MPKIIPTVRFNNFYFCVYVRYTGPNCRPITQFAGIVALESADAVGVTKGIEKGLEAVDIDKRQRQRQRQTCRMQL